jgi:cyclophilin family peptidyl-prolyl cis-trans isomerase
MSYGNGPGYGQQPLQPPTGGGYGQQPPPGGGYGQQPPPGGGHNQAPPPNHLVWAIITLFCCQILGIVSIIFAAQVNGKFQQGDYAGAVDSSNKAKTFAMIGTILGVVQVVGIIIYVVIVGVAVSARTPGYTSSTPDSVSTPGYSTSTPDSIGGACNYLESPDPGAPKDLGRPPVQPGYKGTVGATIKTSLGDVGVSLDAAKAPCSVGSFAFLIKKNYFDNTQCHRLTSGSLRVLQCGDPTGTGTGGPGYRFANENTTGATYTRGVLAMAHSQQPDSNGSQFFIVYGDSMTLPPDYTVFGQVTSGLDVIDQVANAGSDDSNGTGDGKPKKKIEIIDVTIT